MKRIAIIAPCVLPVPASKGGAVEGLITKIIIDNDCQKYLDIDLYSTVDSEFSDSVYENTKIIPIKKGTFQKRADKVLDAYYRRAAGVSAKRILDKEIVSQLKKRLSDRDKEYDAVVIENQMSTAIEILENCRKELSGIPVYFHMHNSVDMYRSPEYIRELVKYGVQFISVSEHIKDDIQRCDKNAVVHILYNGVNLTNIIKKDDIVELGTRFLYSGRIVPGKGVLELVNAFSKMLDKLTPEDRSKYKLDIIGFSNTATRYEKLVLNGAEKYKNNITCQKMIAPKEILEKYYQYDVVVMPTVNNEPFGLVALETIARGVPLITTNSGAIPEIVGDGAVIVDKNTDFERNLSKTILQVSRDQELRQSISENGYKRAREISGFDIENYYTNFVNTIIDANESEEMISVIVPVYNVEEYLERCVDSLIEQTYKNLEIILIDDGSKDSSGEICDRYQKTDKRIKVIHQNNMGLSGARNTGLDSANGDYVFFVDSDDYLETNTLEKLYLKLKKDKADITACGVKMFGDRTGSFTNDEPGIWSGHESVVQMMRTNNICTVAWNKLYRRKLFEEIRFPVGVLHEDEATTYKLLYNSQIVSYTPEQYYNYFQRAGSIMDNKMEERCKDFIGAASNRVKYFKDMGEADLAEHSMITLLDRIKYIYKKIGDKKKKEELCKYYRECVDFFTVPHVMGVKKAMALLLWKYVKY